MRSIRRLIAVVFLIPVLVTLLPTSSSPVAAVTPPAPLINESALQPGTIPSWLEGVPATPGTSNDLFAATPDQQNALHHLQTEAVQNLIRDHQLSAAPNLTAQAQTWGRPAALAELWGLLLKAVQTPPSLRSADQSDAVDWLQSVFNKEAGIQAYYAGIEYLKWGDFNKTFAADKAAYDQDVQTHDWDDLRNVLRPFTEAEPYETRLNDPDAKYGYCNYDSPGNDRDVRYELGVNEEGSQFVVPCNPGDNGSCFPAACHPSGTHVPPFQQFVTWGIDRSFRRLVSDKNLVALLATVTREFPFWVDAKSAAPPGGFGSGFADDAAAAGIAKSLGNVTAAIKPEAEEAANWVGYGFDVTATILDLVGAEIPGLDLVSVAIAVSMAIASAAIAGEIPDHLIELLKNAQGRDVADLAASDGGKASLYIMFLASTLPQPAQSCAAGDSCLNQPPVVPSDGLDTPVFISAADGSLRSHQQDTFAFYDAGSKTCHEVYLRGGWFVDANTVVKTDSLSGGCASASPLLDRESGQPVRNTSQTLSITYTDWDGHRQTAWVLPSGAGGHVFVIEDQTSAAVTLIPGFCFLAGRCGIAGQIFFQDADGARYEAVLNYGDGVPPVPVCTGTCGASSATTTTVSWSPSVPQSLSSAILTATVTSACATGQSCPPPSGTVSFVVNRGGVDSAICSTAPLTNGLATCRWEPSVNPGQPPVAAGTIYATFAPADTNGTAGSQASAYLQVSDLPATATAITLSASTVGRMRPVDVTATVRSTSGAAFPTKKVADMELVTFTSGGETLCSLPIDTSQHASASVTCSATFASAGHHEIVAAYSSNRAQPSQDSATVTVTPDPTSLKVFPIGPLVSGHASPVQVRVAAGGVPSSAITGSLSVDDADEPSNSASCPVAGGVGTCTFTPSAAGSLTLRATFAYAGDAQFGDLSANTTAAETVYDPNVTVNVFGSALAGRTPSFGSTVVGPDFLGVSGTLTCSKAAGGQPLASLSAGTYTMDPTTCSGQTLTIGGVTTPAFHPVYAAPAGDFRVYPDTADTYIVTVTGSQVYSGQPTFSYDVDQVPPGGTGLNGSATCSGVSGGTANLDTTLFVGQYHLTGLTTCTGLTSNDGKPIQYNGGTFTVTPLDVTATVTGSQTYGGGDLHFFARSDVESGTVTCLTVNGGTAIAADMHVAPGPYAIDGTTCSGLASFGGNWRFTYQGQFTVLPQPVTVLPRGSQVYGQGPVFSYTTSPSEIHLGGQLSCTTVGTMTITPTLAPNSYGQLGGCGGLSNPQRDFLIQYATGDSASFVVHGKPLNVGVHGAKTVGGNSTFSYDAAQTILAGTSLGGNVTCTTADGGQAIATLSPGHHTLDSSSCGGLIGLPNNGYAIAYQGGTFSVNQAASVAPTAAPPGRPNTEYKTTLHLTGGTPPFAFDSFASNFGAGTTGLVYTNISADPATGDVTLDGTPTGDGQALLRVSGSDSSGVAFDQTVPIDIVGLTSTPGPTITFGSGSTLTDSVALLERGTSPSGKLTFTLVDPAGGTVSSADVTVTGNSTYVAPNAQAPATVGTYRWDVTFTNAAGSVDGASAMQTVNGGSMTITASSPTILVGAAVPTITAGFSGLASSALQTQPTCSTTYTQGSPTGTYPTSCSGAVAPKTSGGVALFSINYVPGQVTVGGTAPTITGTPPNGTVGSVYGPFAFTVSGSPTPTVSLASGSVPAGLMLSGGGSLSGTPTAKGPTASPPGRRMAYCRMPMTR
jgi:hypothetical protein